MTVGDSGETVKFMVIEPAKEYQSIVNALEKEKVEYCPIQKAEKGRLSKEIISRISGVI